AGPPATAAQAPAGPGSAAGAKVAAPAGDGSTAGGATPATTARAAVAAGAPVPSPAPPRQLAQGFGKTPMIFEANRGQTDAAVKFLSRGPGYGFFLTNNDMVLSLARPSAAPAGPSLPAAMGQDSNSAGRTMDVLGVHFVGANANAKVTGLDEL